MATTKKFFRFKELGMEGLESCDILTEDCFDKWGNQDEATLKRVNTQDMHLMENTEVEHEVIEVAEEIMESLEDRINTLEVALRAIASGDTRDMRFKGKSVTDIATEALKVSKRLEIID